MTELTLANIHCGGCANTVRRVCASVDPQAQVLIDIPTRRVSIESKLAGEKFAQALARAGFPPA